jgi:hypothetical protein
LLAIQEEQAMSFETVAMISAITEVIVISGIVFTLFSVFKARTSADHAETSKAGTIAEPCIYVRENWKRPEGKAEDVPWRHAA